VGPLVACEVVLRAFLDGALFGASSGDGPPRVVLLHGWARTHEDFAQVALDLARAGVASVAFDLPGFGASPPPPGPIGARGYAELLEPAVAQLAEHGPVLVVGHSFGGRVATCLGARAPDLIAGLVLTGVPLLRDSAPKVSPAFGYRVIRRLSRWHLVSQSTLEAARHRYGSSDYRAASGVMRDVLVTLVNESYGPELAGLRCPVGLLWGSNDTTVPVEVARAAARACDQATLELLDGIGHFVPTDAPAQLAAKAVAMLEGVR
jgi:pimeloyl-ACP methyl ester carboxylesterase